MERERPHPAPTPILPVILAGGVGARLSPLSTERRPKPFVPLPDGESLLTKTLSRLHDPRFLPPILIGRAADRFALLNHARASGVMPAAILLEANPRNTAPAVALAAWWTKRHYDTRTCMAVLPADHLVGPEEAWRTTVVQGATAALASDVLCLLAATPDRAESGFGHVRLAPASARQPWQKVEQFIEKPEDPQALLVRGARWNMGQFIGTAEQFLAALAAIPGTRDVAKDLIDRAQLRWEFSELPPWPESVPCESFDRAVLEKNPCVAVPYTGQWQDLGTLPSWEAATGLKTQNSGGFPERIDRPWGYFEHIATFEHEVHKRLILYPDCRLSRQRHQNRAEQWRVLAGIAYVELEDSVQRLEMNQSILIPAGCWHRLGNHHDEILIIEEKQIGICEEADIERIEDDYGRK